MTTTSSRFLARTLIPTLVAAAVLSAALPQTATAVDIGPAPPQRHLVGFTALPSGLAVGGTYQDGTIYALSETLSFIGVESSDEAFKPRAWGDPAVAYVEPDTVMAATAAPNDPHYPQQHALPQVRLPDAWSGFEPDADAAVCVVDSGLRRTHEDLDAARWLGGWDVLQNDADPQPSNAHGTHVTGIAVATADNARGIAGAANVGYYHVRVLDAMNKAHVSVVAQGIDWCARNTMPNTVISVSIGDRRHHETLLRAVDAAVAAGKLVVASAGNDNCDGCVLYPGAYEDVLGVACTGQGESSCPYARGPQIDLSAPGRAILSTCSASDTSYCEDSGTSMSAPLVSGIAALHWAKNPSLTAAQLRASLLAATQDLGDPGVDAVFGRGEIDALCLVQGLSPCAPPSNDAFARAHAPAGMPFDRTQPVGAASVEGGEPVACGAPSATVWYRWTATSVGTLTVSVDAAGFPLSLAAYSGGTLDALTQRACAQDATGADGAGVQLDVATGDVVHVQVGTGGDVGDVTVRMRCAPNDCRPPENDHFHAGVVLPSAAPLSRSLVTHGATVEPAEPLCPDMGATVWYRWKSEWSGQLVVETFNSDYDTSLAVYTGSTLSGLTRTDCNEDAQGTPQSRLQVTITPGTTYHVQVGGYRGQTGQLQLSLQCTGCSEFPANDNYESPEDIDRNRYAHGVSTQTATAQPFEPEPLRTQGCGGSGMRMGRTVWFSLRPEVSGRAIVHTLESDFDTVLALYTGTTAPGLPALVPLACNDDHPTNDGVNNENRSRLEFQAQAGVTYYVQAGGYGDKWGYLALKAECEGCFLDRAGNDRREDAVSVPLLPFSDSRSTSGATSETQEPQPCGDVGSTLWYSYSPLVPGIVRADTVGSDYDTVLAAYVDVKGMLVPLGCSDDYITAGRQSKVVFTALPGFTYYLQAGGHDGAQGALKLNVR